MRWIALTGMSGYLASVVVVRFVLARRWPGVAFVTLRHRTASDIVACAIGAGALAAVVGGALAFHGRWSDLRTTTGLALIAPAAATQAWAQLAMGESWRVGVNREETTRLVRHGPFRWVRNPIYSAIIAMAVGVVVLTPSPWTVAGAVLAVMFAEWQVRVVEEPFLLERHGLSYRGWMRRTGRFVPGLG
jgi:protein-S-isoprenylcysteine O-methyltransferase Ste14